MGGRPERVALAGARGSGGHRAEETLSSSVQTAFARPPPSATAPRSLHVLRGPPRRTGPGRPGEAIGRLLRHQAIADPGLRYDEARFGGFGFEFLPQMRDINAQIMRVLDVVGTPDFEEDLSVGEDLAGVLDEQA